MDKKYKCVEGGDGVVGGDGGGGGGGYYPIPSSPPQTPSPPTERYNDRPLILAQNIQWMFAE